MSVDLRILDFTFDNIKNNLNDSLEKNANGIWPLTNKFLIYRIKTVNLFFISNLTNEVLFLCFGIRVNLKFIYKK